jgi:hypothetical protein
MNSSYQRSDNSRGSSSSNYRGNGGGGGFGGDSGGFANKRGNSNGGHGQLNRDKQMSQMESLNGMKKPNVVNFDLKPFENMFFS